MIQKIKTLFNEYHLSDSPENNNSVPSLCSDDEEDQIYDENLDDPEFLEFFNPETFRSFKQPHFSDNQKDH